MTYEEARRILHPDTIMEALAEIEYYGGFNGEKTIFDAIREACLVACEALDRNIAVDICVNSGEYVTDRYFCPRCSKKQKQSRKNMKKGCFCERCGQKLSFS